MTTISKTDPILEGMARALYVQAWADRQKERGKTYPGQNLMDVAPKTPIGAYLEAAILIGKLETVNRMSLYCLLAKAARADGRPNPEPDCAYYWNPNYCKDFGHYIAMQALGHGVSWSDDHAEFGLIVPHIEFSLFVKG